MDQEWKVGGLTVIGAWSCLLSTLEGEKRGKQFQNDDSAEMRLEDISFSREKEPPFACSVQRAAYPELMAPVAVGISSICKSEHLRRVKESVVAR
jgi:hypothetical protein